MPNDLLLTRAGYDKLAQELKELKSNSRRAVSEAIKEAKAHGDVRENAAYDEAKLNQGRIEGRIAQLEKILLYAKIVERPDGPDHMAHLGSKVCLKDLEFGDSFEVTLVGSYEADANNALMSIVSPLGRELLGKHPGEEVRVEAPDGVQRYRIESVT